MKYFFDSSAYPDRDPGQQTQITTKQQVVLVPLYVNYYIYSALRDWSLIMGRGGATKREGGGTRSFTPTKRGGGKGLSHAEGGTQQVLG